jgi:hypothetical protein
MAPFVAKVGNFTTQEPTEEPVAAIVNELLHASKPKDSDVLAAMVHMG